ncbi:MAG: Do family serine endopeptidase [Bacteroidota bacterium]
MKKLIGYFTLSFVAAIAGAYTYSNFNTNNTANSTTINQETPKVRYVNNPANLPEGAINFETAAETSIHAVVHVKTEYAQNSFNGANDPFYQFFFGEKYNQMPKQMMSSGSGVIISEDGYIATNNHVIQNATKIEVVLNDKRSFEAEVIGKDPSTDLALLKINEKNLPYLGYANSDEVKVGQWVLAVGNPFNLTSTVTAGIISAKGRNINILENDPNKGIVPIESFLQTDAAVNPGNSGGALVNTNGQLVGINSAIASNTGSYAGYSFAIPVNIVKKVMADLVEFGTVQRAFIGVSIRDIDSKLASEKSLKQLKGVYVSGLMDGGSAEQAGVEEGDVITKVGNVEVTTSAELQEQVGKFRPGDKVLITLNREGKEKELSVLLKNKNGNTNVVKTDKPAAVSLLGATFESISKDEMRKLKIENGLKVATLSPGKLRSAGIREGFIITTIDKKVIASVEDLNQVLDNKKGGILIEGIYPNGLRAYYGFGI